MKKKKLNSTPNEENIAPKKSQKELPKKKEKDFGGIPDLDPKKFLDCG